MLSMTFRSDFSKMDALETRVKQNISKAVQKQAEDLAEFIKNSWSPISPSSPGEAPAIVTGALDASVQTESQGRDVLGRFAGRDDATLWTVHAGGPNAPHAAYLEPPAGWLNRPFWQVAIDFIQARSADYYRDIF